MSNIQGIFFVISIQPYPESSFKCTAAVRFIIEYLLPDIPDRKQPA